MPTAQMTRAHDAIQESIEQGARDDAQGDLAAAQDHYQKAKAAADDEQYALARMYAEKAEADAKLAEARAERADATSTLQELQKSIRALQDEIDHHMRSSAGAS